MLILDRDRFDYVPYYCEENVWRLLARRELAGLRAWAVLVSSPAMEVLLLRQRAGRPGDGLIRWDYHAFALVDDRVEGLAVLDLDADLPFPCPTRTYLAATFPRRPASPGQEPFFRMIEAPEYLAAFSSDRSHMRRPDGSWRAAPPPWPCLGAGRPNVLNAWIDGSRRDPGRVLGLDGLGALAERGERSAGKLRRMR